MNLSIAASNTVIPTVYHPVNPVSANNDWTGRNLVHLVPNSFKVPDHNLVLPGPYPPSSNKPLTPDSDNARDALSQDQALDLKELINPRLLDPPLVVSMTPGKGGLQHSNSYTYVTDQYQDDISHERSTVSPVRPTTTAVSTDWPAKLNPPALNTSPWSAPPVRIGPTLPPLRTQAPQLNAQLAPPALPSAHSYTPSPPVWAYAQSQHVPYAYTTSSTTQYTQHSVHRNSLPSSTTYGYYPHAPHPSTSSVAIPELQTPSTAGFQWSGYPNTSSSGDGYGTVQPSAFQGWQNEAHGRARGATVSGAALTDSLSPEDPKTEERRASSPAPRLTDDWKSESLMETKSSDGESELQEVEPDQIVYTMDAEIKQTAEIRRMCYNCQTKKPPSWRKSHLYPGKILCNTNTECGIFERAHKKARPQQNDEQKLRKPTQERVPRAPPHLYPQHSSYGQSGHRHHPPPQLQNIRGAVSDESPLPSPYSTVPSQQVTPVTAPSYTFPAYQTPNHTAYQTPNHPIPCSAGPTTGSFTLPPPPGLGTRGAWPPRRHSQANAVGLLQLDTRFRPLHGHGQSSPYAHAYARRTASSNTTATLSSSARLAQGSILGTAVSRTQETVAIPRPRLLPITRLHPNIRLSGVPAGGIVMTPDTRKISRFSRSRSIERF